VQKPHPPITIGGSGEKLTLKVTARCADRYDWGYLPSLKLYKHKLRVLENHCKALRRDFREIEKSCWLGGQIFVAPNQKELDEKVRQQKPRGVSVEDFEKFSLIATPDGCIKRIRQYTGLGVTYFMLFFGDFPSLNGTRFFAEEVVKKMEFDAQENYDSEHK
jgi:alkanesulfonate monooxygenase SsuD/methylene tetrahydromethanopterin reductase-like flavin-dependent oxidoreductase (luciferase family)